MSWTWALTVATVLAGLAGCGDSTDRTEAVTPTSAPTSSTPGEAAGQFMLVPALVGLDRRHLGEHLARHAVVLGTVRTDDRPCLPAGQVLEQSPAENTRVAEGSAVDVVVNQPAGECGGELPPAADDLARVAELFLAFARGEHPEPPIDTPVSLYLGGRPTAVLSNHDAGRREAWSTCPKGGSYAGRTCPFSAVDLLRGDAPVVITGRPPVHPCAHPAPLPGRTVTLTPSGARSCVDYWAVQLGVNDVGQVTGVNVVISEP